MIKEYLADRIRIIEKELDLLDEKKKMCEVSIKQINAQIFEVENESDEISKMLSVSVRDSLASKDEEVDSMKKHINQCYEEINNYNKEIKEKKQEIELIKLCQNEVEEINVSRETLVNDSETSTNIFKNEEPSSFNKSLDVTNKNFDEEQYVQNKKIKEKLEFCLKICRVDGNRVSLELKNILKDM